MSHLRVRLVLGSLGLALAAPACEWNDVLNPRFGYEYEDVKCSNHIDDDYDGLIDCEDPDCLFTSGLCGEYVPEGKPGQEREETFALCTDGIDNDYNGQFDCGDPKCQAIAEVCCFKEFSNDRCSDGVDNDQNGYADCGDFQCRNGMFVDVCNDVDYPPCETDESCFGPENTLERCQDGRDNDGNGHGDCNDFACTDPDIAPPEAVAFCLTKAEDTVAKCSDGLDNDGDGYEDCQDRSCSGKDAPESTKDYCSTVLENTLAECSDGLDNDGNGYVDCQDRSCSGVDMLEDIENGVADKQSELDALVAHCDAVLERGPGECSDGIDNDTNGYVDCADFSCRNSNDFAVQAVCQESLGETTIQVDIVCGDEIDNDGDGFVDCDDWDCNWNPLVTVCPKAGQKRVCE